MIDFHGLLILLKKLILFFIFKPLKIPRLIKFSPLSFSDSSYKFMPA